MKVAYDQRSPVTIFKAQMRTPWRQKTPKIPTAESIEMLAYGKMEVIIKVSM